MGKYTTNGLYNSYDKKHSERDKLDYYATKPGETKNILDILSLNFNKNTILEPCVGGGHMARDISIYIKENNMRTTLIGTDIKDRGFSADEWQLEYELDFFDDDYPIDKADYIIMNPPFATIEPFTIRALEIAEKGVIMLARLQFLEGQGRYENILKDNPPTDVYVYVDRIKCYKNGDLSQTESSAQAYAWFYWDKENPKETTLHWIHRR